MKGLLIKDLKILKNLRRNFLVFFALGLMFLFAKKDTSLFVVYASLSIFSVVLATLNYDYADNGMPFILTLPISRKDYVIEKYLLMIVLGIAVSIVAIVLSFVGLNYILDAPMSFGDIAIQTISSISVMMAFCAINIPIFLKNGPEKARAVMFIIFGIVFLGGYVVSQVLKDKITIYLENLKPLFEKPALLFVIGLGIVIAIILITLFISLNIIKNKEF